MKAHLISPNTQWTRTIRSGWHAVLVAVALGSMLTTQMIAQSPAAANSTSSSQPQNATLTSAPTPTVEDARLTTPLNQLHIDLAASDAAKSAVTASGQPAHHALAKTAIVAGIVLAGFGAGAFALADSHCSTGKGLCGPLHNGGIAAMAGGAGLAGVGFYFNFHKKH